MVVMDEVVEQGLSLYFFVGVMFVFFVWFVYSCVFWLGDGVIVIVLFVYLGEGVGVVMFEWVMLVVGIELLVDDFEYVVSLVGFVLYLMYLCDVLWYMCVKCSLCWVW